MIESEISKDRPYALNDDLMINPTSYKITTEDLEISYTSSKEITRALGMLKEWKYAKSFTSDKIVFANSDFEVGQNRMSVLDVNYKDGTYGRFTGGIIVIKEDVAPEPPPEIDNAPVISQDLADKVSFVGDVVNISYSASDDKGINKHEFFNGNEWIVITPNLIDGIYLFDYTFDAPGSYNCKVRVTDSKNQESVSNVFSVTVKDKIINTFEVVGAPFKAETGSKVIIPYKSSSNFSTAYMYGVKGVINSESVDSENIIFPSIEIGVYDSAYIGLYLNGEWVTSSKFKLEIIDKPVVIPPEPEPEPEPSPPTVKESPIKLYDKTGNNLIGELDNIERAKVIEERNGEFKLELTYVIGSALQESIVEGNILVAKANDRFLNQKFRIYATRKMMTNRIEVFARHISYDLANDFIEKLDIINQSCEYCLNQIFRNSQFSTGYRGYSDIVNAQDYKISMVNALSAIMGTEGSVIDTFGTGPEILRDNTNIHVLERRGHDNGVEIAYSKNMTDITVDEDRTDLITRIYAYAKTSDDQGGEVIITAPNKFVDSPNIGLYSHPYVRAIDFSDKFNQNDAVTPRKIQALAEKYFRDNKCDFPRLSYKLNFIPLSKTTESSIAMDDIELCDIVNVIDTRYNIRTKAKAIRVVFNLLTDRYDSIELGEPRSTNLGITGDASQGPPGPPGPQGPPGADGDIGDFPDSLPATPVLTAKVLGFYAIDLSWTFEDKVYYTYELYASKVEGFTPTAFDLIHEGQTSSFPHAVKPGETWYFKVCAKNSHGRRTAFSAQVEGTSRKSDDFKDYFSSLGVGNLVAGIFTADYMQAGIIKGNWIDAKNLSVTDGNGKRTLDIDSFGNVTIMPSVFKVLVEGKEDDVVTRTQFTQENGRFEFAITQAGGKNYVRNSQFSKGTRYWGNYNSEIIKIPNSDYEWLGGFMPGTGIGIRIADKRQGTLFTENIEVETDSYYSVSLNAYKMSNVAWAEVWIEEKRKDGSIIFAHSVGTVSNDVRFGGTINVTNPECRYLTVVIKHGGVKELGKGNDVVYVNNVKLEQGNHITKHCNNDNELYVENVSIDTEGFHVKNVDGSSVNLSGDDFNFTDSQGYKALGFSNGGMTFHTTNKPEFVGFLRPSTYFPNDLRYNGVNFMMSEQGDYIAIGANDVLDESVSQGLPYIFMMRKDIPGILDGKKGTYLLNMPVISKVPMYCDEPVTMQNQTVFNRQLVIRSNDEYLPHFVHTHNPTLNIYGKDGVSLGVVDDGNYYQGLRLVKARDYSNKCYIYIDADMDFSHQYFIKNANLIGCNIHSTQIIADIEVPQKKIGLREGTFDVIDTVREMRKEIELLKDEIRLLKEKA